MPCRSRPFFRSGEERRRTKRASISTRSRRGITVRSLGASLSSPSPSSPLAFSCPRARSPGKKCPPIDVAVARDKDSREIALIASSIGDAEIFRGSREIARLIRENTNNRAARVVLERSEWREKAAYFCTVTRSTHLGPRINIKTLIYPRRTCWHDSTVIRHPRENSARVAIHETRAR